MPRPNARAIAEAAKAAVDAAPVIPASSAKVETQAEVVEPETAPNQPPSTAIVIGSWHLEQFPGDPEPRILDVVLAERLGYSEPRSIRKLIKRLDEQGKIPGVLAAIHTERGLNRGNSTTEVAVEAYYLDEKNALRVIRRCETDKADEVMDEVISVYLAVRKGTLPAVMTAAQQLRLMADVAERQEALAADNEAIRQKQAEQDAATKAAQQAADEARAKAEQERKDREEADELERKGSGVTGRLRGSWE